jgi:hydroxymethylbilane synthase
MNTTLTIGTRESPLALLQTQRVVDALTLLGFKSRIVPIKTKADRFLDKPLVDIGGKALFSRELDQGLISQSLDLCVHSLKDLEAELHPDLHIIATLKRDNPYDVCVLKPSDTPKTPTPPELLWPFLPKHAVVGTCAPRRKAFLLHHRPDLTILPLRGNIQKRLETLHQQNLDAIIIAKAALDRLNLNLPQSYTLKPELMLPACSQGVIAVVSRKNAFPSPYHNPEISSPLAPLNHTTTALSSRAERMSLSLLGCSCQSPVAAFAYKKNQNLHLSSAILSPQGNEIYQESSSQPLLEKPENLPENLGETVGQKLLHSLPNSLISQLNLTPRTTSKTTSKTLL